MITSVTCGFCDGTDHFYSSADSYQPQGVFISPLGLGSFVCVTPCQANIFRYNQIAAAETANKTKNNATNNNNSLSPQPRPILQLLINKSG